MSAIELKEFYELGIASATILIGLTIAILKYKKAKKVHVAIKKESEFSISNMEIWKIITDLRVDVDATRVSVVQFHNGGKFMDGTSMRKMSITHQSYDSSTWSTAALMQDTLVTRFIEVTSLLQQNCPSIRSPITHTECNTKRFYSMNNTNAISLLPIYGEANLLIHGYISIEWEKEPKLIPEKTLTAITLARDTIAMLLHSSK
jgi:hypothetical protein